MSNRREIWKYRIGSLLLGAIAVALAVGWWHDHRRQYAQGQTAVLKNRSLDPEGGTRMAQPPLPERTDRKQLASILRNPRPKSTYRSLQSRNDDLIHFVDEAYTLLYENGIHVQLDLETTPDGHLRLKADTLKLMDELQTKLKQIDAAPAESAEESSR